MKSIRPDSYSQSQKWVIFAVVGVIAIVFFFGPTDNWSWDPSFYYAQLRAPIVDHTLAFQRELITGKYPVPLSETGLPNTPWPLGPGLLWSPFFVLTHLAVKALNPANATGFWFPYISVVALSSVGFGFAALLLIYRTCRHIVGHSFALLTTLLALLATPLFFYTFRQPIMAHTTGLFATALITYLYVTLVRQPGHQRHAGLLFGVAFGLCLLTRWISVLFVAVPIAYFMFFFIRYTRQRMIAERRALLVQTAIFAGVTLLTVAPQLAFWYRLHLRPIVLPQDGSTFIPGVLPQNLPLIFVGTNRGVLFWCPFALLGIIGLIWLKDRALLVLSAVVISLQLVLIGYRVDWYGGGGFGARYFIELLPLLAVGFVSAISRLKVTPARGWLLAGLALVLIGHQMILVYAVEHLTESPLPIREYLGGQPLGLQWQLQMATDLLTHPSLWLQPRPFVGQDRQTMVTNLVAGVRSSAIYAIPLIALVGSPVMIGLLWLMGRIGRTRSYTLCAATIGLMLGWAVYLLLL